MTYDAINGHIKYVHVCVSMFIVPLYHPSLGLQPNPGVESPPNVSLIWTRNKAKPLRPATTVASTQSGNGTCCWTWQQKVVWSYWFWVEGQRIHGFCFQTHEENNAVNGIQHDSKFNRILERIRISVVHVGWTPIHPYPDNFMKTPCDYPVPTFSGLYTARQM